jgi:hypothetical protein
MAANSALTIGIDVAAQIFVLAYLMANQLLTKRALKPISAWFAVNYHQHILRWKCCAFCLIKLLR